MTFPLRFRSAAAVVLALVVLGFGLGCLEPQRGNLLEHASPKNPDFNPE